MAWIAIVTIALQALFPTFAGPYPSASLDPTICHSDAPSSDRQSAPPEAGHDCCKQCILSGSVPVATTPATPTLLVLSPTPGNALAWVASHPLPPHYSPGANLARGPPRAT